MQDVIRNFLKRNFLWGKDIIKWKIWSRSLLVLNQGFGKGRGRKLVVKKCKYLTFKTYWVSYCTKTYHWGGSGGGAPSRRWLLGSVGKAPSRWAIFVTFGKKRYFNPTGSHFARVYSRDGNRSGRPAPVGWVAGRVEILRPAGQAGWKTGQILLSGN